MPSIAFCDLCSHSNVKCIGYECPISVSNIAELLVNVNITVPLRYPAARYVGDKSSPVTESQTAGRSSV